MAVLGHKTLTEAERYTREADSGAPCRRSVGEAGRTKRERICPNRFLTVWAMGQKQKKNQCEQTETGGGRSRIRTRLHPRIPC